MMNARPARAQWVVNGVLASTSALDVSPPFAAPDGYGGALVVWTEDFIPSPDPIGFVYVQRYASDGTVVWGPTAVGLTLPGIQGFRPRVVTDGEGGAVVAWSDWFTGDRVRVQRVNFFGTPAWTAGGVPFGPDLGPEWYCDLIPAGGGAIVVWRDLRGPIAINSDIYCQRIDPAGTNVWTATGVPVCTHPGSQEYPAIISDGESGAIIVWADYRYDALGDIYAQRINFFGMPVWTANGVAVCTTVGAQNFPVMTTDGASGVIVAWEADQDVYAQRLNYAGVPQWMANGEPIAVLPTSNQVAVSIASDDNGGAFAFWLDTRNFVTERNEVYGQRVSGSGSAYWIANGVKLTNAPDLLEGFQTSATRDEAGGAMVAYAMDPVGTSAVRAFRVDPQGTVLWDETVADATTNGYQPVIVGAGLGAAILAWQDLRSGSQTQAYAMMVPMIVADAENRAPSIPSLRIVSVTPNPFSETTEVVVDLASAGRLDIEVFDAVGKRLHTHHYSEMAPGSRLIRLLSRDESGAPLPSGVYFLRASSAGATATRKLVVIR
jgi:hypothetical protein